jgi:excisionase family DNA binding protein
MLLTVKHVATSLNVTRSCVYAILRASNLPTIRIGFGRGTIRIEESDLDDFIRRNTVPRRGKVYRA